MIHSGGHAIREVPAIAVDTPSARARGAWDAATGM